MLQEQNPQSYERDMLIIAIKDAFVAVGQSVETIRLCPRTADRNVDRIDVLIPLETTKPNRLYSEQRLTLN